MRLVALYLFMSACSMAHTFQFSLKRNEWPQTKDDARTISKKQVSVAVVAASWLISSLGAPSAVLARSDFMSPEAEGGGGRFGRVSSPESQVQVPQVPEKAANANDKLAKGFQTKTGLKYFDIREGTGKSPRYGELVTFQYILYYKAPDRDSSLELVDKSSEPYLQKHGNGRIVRGLDEGLHTMKEGGRRRVIVPKNIGYTDIGIGPLPMDHSNRRRLGDLIDILQADQGELIFDVELVQVKRDENDQGYYDDVPITQDEVRELVEKSLRDMKGGKSGGADVIFEEAKKSSA